MDDIESFSSNEEEIEAEGEDVEHTKDTPSASPEDPSEPPISQKCTHESSSSDSDKETPPIALNNKQVVPADLHCCGSFAFTFEIFLKTPKKTYMLENVKKFVYRKRIFDLYVGVLTLCAEM